MPKAELKPVSFKPNKSAFIYYPLLIGFIINAVVFIVLFSIASFLLQTISPLPFILIFLIVETYSIINRHLRYNKEEYLIYSDRLIQKGGSIFSNYQTELIVKNITHVKMSMPFIESKWYGTGNILIQSAGSAATQIYLHAIDTPEKIYNQIATLMQKNGFRLTGKQLLQQESPDTLGAFFEVGKQSIGIVAGFFIAGSWLFGASILILKKATGKVNFDIIVIISALVIALIILLIYLIFHFIDLIRRKYYIYTDMIIYTEGFLTKHYAFMPVENLADSETNQTIIDRIFGLYDVIISCQGSGQEIVFKNMRNGQELEKNIDALIAKYASLARTKETSSGMSAMTEEKTQKIATSSRLSAAKVSPTSSAIHKITTTNFTGEYKMNTVRAIAPVFMVLPLFIILFPILIYWGIYLVSVIIQMVGTSYYIKQNSIEERFKFIHIKNKEFSLDKITLVIIRESIIDKWFDTIKVEFRSIGSSGSIVFKHLKKTPDLIPNILAKTGIQQDQLLYSVAADFSFGEMIKAKLFSTIVWLLIFAATIISGLFWSPLVFIGTILMIVALIPTILYLQAYYEDTKLSFFKNYVYCKKGLIVKEHFYAHYPNIKDLTITKYACSNHGTAYFNVAGEMLVSTGKSQTIVSSGFSINYVPNIQDKDELIDIILDRHPSSEQIKKIEQNINAHKETPLMLVKPSIANSMIKTIIFLTIITMVGISAAMFLVPQAEGLRDLIIAGIIGLIIAFDLFILILVIISVKVKSYAIESYRVVEKSGIIYKKQTSIIFDKIDFINTYEGMLNKLFRNGNITVNTAGSSAPELVISNIPEYKEFYEMLKKYYKK
ncbi:PH domain-containing protein [Candidatus Woesearchaeota archaeon]|nr:PH domain-containing protein [Candidatus Woesearchaeota archaeon]